MKGLLFPSLLYLLWCTSFAMASQCNVFSSTYGKYLKNNLVQSIPNTNLQNCTDQCIVAGFCRSTNFHFESKTCELNIADKHDFPNDYTERQGYSYGGWRTKKPVPQSCSEAKARKRSAKSGYYLIRTKRGKILTVYCDMEKYDGGWTLVVSVSAVNNDHLQREENNCIVNSSLCVQYETTAVQARKLSDQDIIDIMSEYGKYQIVFVLILLELERGRGRG
ncbi:uncharacterized protein LOC116289986 [Actinia tenebrosa]|uniref:Uncharacterized protein LOC116289986 n=1 Tax=Actinia tenebrosa TaxID=6105 RepID=A0A6P8HB17_ACTTE|nr:uncharacterized protein LOC116289986 [Actinia tenebrosa]